MKGIDVSVHQGTIDWEKVKPNIDFAIIRCGLGNNIESQDDKQFERNYSECVRLGIPFSVYLFSYGMTETNVRSEVEHIKRLLSGKTIKAPVYIDIENTSGLDWRGISNDELLRLMQLYNSLLNEAGFKMGIYSSRSAFWNEKMTDSWYDGISKWVAEYGSQLTNFTRTYDIWQSSSSGTVDGISGRVDTDEMVNNIFFETVTVTEEPKKTTAELVVEIMQGKWGNGAERKQRLESAGYDYGTIQNAVDLYVKSQKEAAAVKHTVTKGETLSGIAKKYGTTYQKIAADNGISNPNLIRVGQVLVINK